MLQVPIEDINESHLQSLVTEGRQEDTQLEFKLTLPGKSDEEKREFLKDVSAMDVTELRNAFLLSDTLAQRLETFRKDRLEEIVDNHRDLRLETDWSDHKPSSTDEERESLLVIHLQPFDSAKPGYAVDITQGLRDDSDALRLCSDPYGEPSRRFNFDGLLVTYADDFLQVYRSSATEEVDSGELRSEVDGNRFDVECIGATELDWAIFKGVGRRLALLKQLGVSSPVLVSVSLMGVMGCKLLLRRTFYVGSNPGGINFILSPHAVDRQNLLLTGLVIENLQELPLERVGDSPSGWRTVQSLLRPYCDSIWN